LQHVPYYYVQIPPIPKTFKEFVLSWIVLQASSVFTYQGRCWQNKEYMD